MKYPNVAQRFIEAMNDNNLKAVDLAEKSGVPKGTISRYVNGVNAPTNVIAGRIAEVLNVTPMWLMGFENAPKYPLEQVISQKDVEQSDFVKSEYFTRMEVYYSLLSKKQLNAIDEFIRDVIKNNKFK